MVMPQWHRCPQYAARVLQLSRGVKYGASTRLSPDSGVEAPHCCRQPLSQSPHVSLQLKEDHQKALLRREFELQSLNLQRRLEQKFWSQEKNLLVQESQQFRQSFLLLFMKLKWFLKRWRQGKMVHSEGEDFLEVLWAEGLPPLPWRGDHAVGHPWGCPSCLHVPPRPAWVSPIPGRGLWVPSSPQPWCLPQVNSMKELYLLLEEEELAPQQQADNKTCAGDTWTPNTVSEVLTSSGGGQDQPPPWLHGMG